MLFLVPQPEELAFRMSSKGSADVCQVGTSENSSSKGMRSHGRIRGLERLEWSGHQGNRDMSQKERLGHTDKDLGHPAKDPSLLRTYPGDNL